MTSVEREVRDGAVGAGRRPRRAWDALPAVVALRAAPRRSLGVCTAVALFSLVVYALVRHFVGTSMVDMIVYRAEGAAVTSGGDLYGMRVTEWNLPATYPPFAAMVFVPTGWVPVGPLRVLVTLGNLGMLALAAHLSFHLTGWPRRPLRPAGVVLATGLGVWLEPVFTTLRYGQVNLLLLTLVLWDLTRPDRARTRGVAIGLAAGIKLTPGLFTVYLLVTGRVRAAFVSGLAFLGTVLLGWILLPEASDGFWTRYLYDSSRVGKTGIVDNQSLRGLVARLLHRADPGLAAVVAVGVVALLGMAAAAYAARSGPGLPRAQAWGGVGCAVTGLLVSPISWTHHWVWCLPLLVLLAAEASREAARPASSRAYEAGSREAAGWGARYAPRTAAARWPRLLHRLRWRLLLAAGVLAFASYCMWLVPHQGDRDLHLPLWEQLPAGVYPVTGLVWLGLTAVYVRRRRAAGGPAARPAAEAVRRAGTGPREQSAPA